MGERIKKQSHNLDITICDKLSLENLISVVSQMDLIIGPDSGPTHMAWALNIPSIMLFGPTPGYRNTLSTRINKVIESDSKVNPLTLVFERAIFEQPSTEEYFFAVLTANIFPCIA